MGKWVIDKKFFLDFGHRVHNQQLNTEFSIDGSCACRFMHGHTGMVHVFLESTELEGGFVTDFKHLNWFGKFLDDYLDHKFILDINDPWFVNIINGTPMYEDGKLIGLKPTLPLNTSNADVLPVDEVVVPGTNHVVGHRVNVDSLSGPEREYLEGFFIVGFVPTSEHFTKWLYEIVDIKMSPIGVKVSKISWNETPKSRAVYSG